VHLSQIGFWMITCERNVRLKLSVVFVHIKNSRSNIKINLVNNLLPPLTERVMWGIDITWCPSSSVSVYILIFFSKTSEPIVTKLGRNVLWLVCNQCYVFFVDQKYIKEAQRCQKGCVHINGYKLFIVHLFFMHSRAILVVIV
jgi:hypothetical protein